MGNKTEETGNLGEGSFVNKVNRSKLKHIVDWRA